MNQYLIVCPLVFLAGIIDSVGGGGGLISLPAYFVAGLPAHVAIGTNKLGSTMGTGVSLMRFIKNGCLSEKSIRKATVLAVIAALCGSSIGAQLSLMASEAIIKNMMIFILPIVAFYVLKNKNMGDEKLVDCIPVRRMLCITVVAAFVVGMYDGFYGPGTGTFLVLILTGAAKMKLKVASGVTKAINFSSNVAALTTFLFSGQVILALGLTAGVFSIAGNYIGSGLVLHNGQKIVRPVILIVLAILFVKIIQG